jgi:hypothetical protein
MMPMTTIIQPLLPSRGGGGGGYADSDADADSYASPTCIKAKGNRFFSQNNGHGQGRCRNFIYVNKANEKSYSQTLAAVSDIEKLAQKKGPNHLDERFRVLPDERPIPLPLSTGKSCDKK